MHPKIRDLGSYALGATIFVAVMCIPAVFILGTTWFAGKALPLLFAACWIALAIDVLALLFSVFRKLRPVTGTVIYFSSLVLGLTSWLFSFVLTLDLWGTFAVIIGLLLLGGAVVPFALLATLFKGMWGVAALVTGLFVLTFAARLGGAAISESR